jgi:hypothetical protein
MGISLSHSKLKPSFELKEEKKNNLLSISLFGNCGNASFADSSPSKEMICFLC